MDDPEVQVHRSLRSVARQGLHCTRSPRMDPDLRRAARPSTTHDLIVDSCTRRTEFVGVSSLWTPLANRERPPTVECCATEHFRAWRTPERCVSRADAVPCFSGLVRGGRPE